MIRDIPGEAETVLGYLLWVAIVLALLWAARSVLQANRAKQTSEPAESLNRVLTCLRSPSVSCNHTLRATRISNNPDGTQTTEYRCPKCGSEFLGISGPSREKTDE